jgi:hypothetical protein
MGFDTKTYWLTDRQSQCDFDFDFDLKKFSWALQERLGRDSWQEFCMGGCEKKPREEKAEESHC